VAEDRPIALAARNVAIGRDGNGRAGFSGGPGGPV
jgi:hypothetical protein